VKKRVEEKNESAMYLLGGTEGNSFDRLKKGARILQRYTETQLSEERVFERIEKRNLTELLTDFWVIMEPFEDVQIIEKNTELLTASPELEEVKVKVTPPTTIDVHRSCLTRSRSSADKNPA
jgi:hypothetical protein